jgi:hypothetical protein
MGTGLHPGGASGLRGEHLAEQPPDHLAGGHAPAARGGFEFQGLPEGEQEGELNDFLVCAACVRRDRIEKRLHGITCHGGATDEVASFTGRKVLKARVSIGPVRGHPIRSRG